jgi:hypothetical protein
VILILTEAGDVHADALEPELADLGAPWARLDTAAAPDALLLGFAADADGSSRRRLRPAPADVDPDGSTASARTGGPAADIDLDAVTAVWWRRPGRPGEPRSLAGTPAGALAADELGSVVADLLDGLDETASGPVLHLPAPHPVTARAQQKLRQLRLAGRLGFELPPTVVSTDPDEVLDFVARHGRCISKRATPGLPMRDAAGAEVFRYTQSLRPTDLLHADALRLCPVIVQAYVPKALELRATVVGQRVLTAEIDSQGTHRTRDDWRHYDLAHTRMTGHRLPADVEHRCVALTEALGLHFGTVDLVLTPDGRYVFLELNPSGQYLWVEQQTGLPITRAVAELLAHGVRTAGTVDRPVGPGAAA